jgi:TrpR family trp operon transcriptional repressor
MKHKNKKIPEYKQELVDVFYKISKNKELAALFLRDILTPNELEAVALRFQIIKRLNNKEDQRSIAGDLGLGVSTVTRGSRMLRNKNGGFNLFFKKFSK